ncbi:MAG: hypothetical protein DHS20C18_27480 [Saprospiraceae bacterium]|nr:MAG: hypothetical protein DHS20C18_27480 [Saprospiraceae bacterium]
MNPEVNEVIQEHHYYPFGMEFEGPWTVHPQKEMAYLFNGNEAMNEVGNRVYDFNFRTYDGAIGRYYQTDLLSEWASSWTPYRFGFNNPINYWDPLGLFESRRDARRHRRSEGVKGRVRKQEDGSFAIVHKGSDGKIKTYNDEEFGVVTEFTYSQIQYPQGTIKSREPNFFEKVKDRGFLGLMTYNIANDAWLTAQRFNPFDTHTTHLSGDYASKNEYTMSFVNTVATVVPIGRATSTVRVVAPQGLTIAQRLNAAQYSKFFKGTSLARMHPKTRGRLNRLMNTGIDNVNKNVETGNILFTPVKSAGKAVNKE